MIRTKLHHAVFGLDLGQSGDPSALTLLLHLEQIHSPFTWIDSTHPVTHTWQLAATRIFPLGTAYLKLARQVHRQLQHFHSLYPHVPLTLIADSTGLGRPTLEILHQELDPHVRLEGMVFTGGQQHSRHRHPSLSVDLYHVPKLDLIQHLLHAIECRHLTISPGLKDKETLREQLQSLRYASSRLTGQTTIAVANQSGNPTIGHADLVMALSMAAWRLKEIAPQHPIPMPGRLPGF